MSRLTHLLWPVFLNLIHAGLTQEDICQRCECLPGLGPTQAICRDNGFTDKDFLPVTTEHSASLELVYIYGIKTVIFQQNSIVTDKPVTLLIQNCSSVIIFDQAVVQLRTLIIRNAIRVQVGILPQEALWATVLEDIEQLNITSASLSANYSVSIGHIESLNLLPSKEDRICNVNPEFTFILFDSKVKSIDKGGMSLCGGKITINGNNFEFVLEEGFQMATEGSIIIVNNNFINLQKQAFNLSAPEIHITSNHFENLPAGVLRGVSTIQDTFFTNNTIADVDLGGVLLDMGWDMIVEQNIIDCDCASKRTSILNPKQDMIYLTNSSLEKLHNILIHNFCNLDCTVTLKEFSYGLIHGDVCVKNDTKLEQGVLCNITIVPDSTTLSSTITSENYTDNTFVYSAATRVEFLVPLIIIVVTVLITSSVCYGCKEMNSFKYIFNPNGHGGPKTSNQ